MVSLREYVEHVMWGNRTRGMATPGYVFATHFQRVCGDVSTRSSVFEQWSELPQFITNASARYSFDFRRTFQWFVGDVHTGAPLHFHMAAFNMLIYGRKRWAAIPPQERVFSVQPAGRLFRDGGLLHLRRVQRLRVDECVQEAGDMLLMPRAWAHATLNLMQSVGIAGEWLLNEQH
jgi:hypothetical protein